MEHRRWRAPSGAEIDFTALGQGGAPLGHLYRAVSDEDAEATLEAAWEAGVRYFDTAPLYGLGISEERFGRFLRAKPRDSFVLSTKVGRLLEDCAPEERTGRGKFFQTPNRREVFDYSGDGVKRSLEASLQRLGLDRVDILFAHDVDVFTHGSTQARDAHVVQLMNGGYQALEAMRSEGAIKAFGAGVNEWEVCQNLLRMGEFDLFLLAGRYTLLEQNALNSFLPICQRRGVGIVIGGPYNSGVLASGGKPGSYYNYDLAPKPIRERVERMAAVCESHGVSLAAAALRFTLLHPCTVSAIPGAVGAEEVAANAAAMRAEIPVALWDDLKEQKLLRPDAPTGGSA